MAGVPGWQLRYSRKLFYTDTLIIVLSLGISEWIRLSHRFSDLAWNEPQQFALIRDYTLISLLLAYGWAVSLVVFDTRDVRVFATGPDEYKRVINATLTTFGIFSIIMFAMNFSTGRGHLFIAFPCGLFLLLCGRWAWRKRLQQQRKRGRNVYRTLIAGEAEKCDHTVRQLQVNKIAGFHVVGAITTKDKELKATERLGNLDDIETVIDEHLPDAVILTGSDQLTPQRIREIGWHLEGSNTDLIVATSLTDITGPRLHMRPVSGFPLLHVEYPEFNGKRYLTKRLFDVIVSGFALLLLSPVFLVTYILVRCDSKGPGFFAQERNGLNGSIFTMYKFRTMLEGSPNQQLGLLDRTDGFGPLFKLKNDPRVTRFGRFLRRHSIDELPQLWNVFRGDMSLVGPRPPLPNEVQQYTEWVHRRMLVKPGISGLWQINGRSDLPWEESVRLDLFYVENWSFIGDLLIMWRTIRVVVKGVGAY